MNLGQTVQVQAIGAKGIVGEVSSRGQCRVDFPDGRWGWHYPNELEACDLDFEAEKKRCGEAVALQNWEHRKAMMGWYIEPTETPSLDGEES
jgi:hypothetical protein